MTKYYMVSSFDGETKILNRKKWKQFLFEEELDESCMMKTKNHPTTHKFHKGFKLVSVSYEEDEEVKVETPIIPDTFIGGILKAFKKKQKVR